MGRPRVGPGVAGEARAGGSVGVAGPSVTPVNRVAIGGAPVTPVNREAIGGRAGALTVGLCRDPRAFTRLREEWDDLQRRCSTATPFQHHSWLDSWWLSYGGNGRLRIVLVRRGGRLVAAAPLMLVHRPLPQLVWLGGSISDYGDILVDDTADTGAASDTGDGRNGGGGGDSARAITALARGLTRAAGPAVLDLREVRPGAAAERLYECWPGPKRRLPDSVCLELPATTMDELVKRLPASRAQRVRAKLRKIDAARIEGRPVTEHEVPTAIGQLLRLHELQWRGRGVTAEHLRPRFAEHLMRATRRMIRDGDAALTEYRMDGEVVAVGVALFSGRLTGGYLYGAHPGLRERKIDVATMLLRHDTELAARTGRRVVSLLRGSEPYKNQWRPEPVTNQRLLLAPPGLAPLLRLHAARASWRERVAGAVTERFPAVREWRARLKDWRAAARSR